MSCQSSSDIQVRDAASQGEGVFRYISDRREVRRTFGGLTLAIWEHFWC